MRRLLHKKNALPDLSLSLIITFLLLSGCAGSVAVPTPIAQIDQSALRVDTTYPSEMQIHTSAIIDVTLRSSSGGPISGIPIEKATVVSSDATPVGTPGTSLSDAFGKDYSPVVTATLNPSDGPFSITPILAPGQKDQTQPLDRTTVEWRWTIFAQAASNQILDVDIEASWVSSKGDKTDSYRIGQKEISINVIDPSLEPTPTPTPTPFISLGHIDLGSLITSIIVGLLGAGGLGAVFILWLVNQARRIRLQKNPPKANEDPPTKANAKVEARPSLPLLNDEE